MGQDRIVAVAQIVEQTIDVDLLELEDVNAIAMWTSQTHRLAPVADERLMIRTFVHGRGDSFLSGRTNESQLQLSALFHLTKNARDWRTFQRRLSDSLPARVSVHA
jgi:hypothetical protein